MSNLNKVMLIGNCAGKPECRETQSGKKVANLRVATNRWWRDDSGEHQSTEWHDVVTWDRLAEQCSEQLEKGRQVFVEGRIKTSSWKDEQGQDRYKKEIVASRVSFLGSRPQAAA